MIRYDSDAAFEHLRISYSEGTKSGLYQFFAGFAAQQTPIGQERIRDVEGGYKVEGAGLIGLKLAGFHYNYENLQVATYENGLRS